MSSEIIAVAENGYPVTQADIDRWNEAYDKGELPKGYSFDGEVKQGRPRLFADGTSSLTVRIPVGLKNYVTNKASERGISVSDYVREVLAMS